MITLDDTQTLDTPKTARCDHIRKQGRYPNTGWLSSMNDRMPSSHAAASKDSVCMVAAHLALAYAAMHDTCPAL